MNSLYQPKRVLHAPDDRAGVGEYKKPYVTPSIDTLPTNKILEALGPAQGMSSGVEQVYEPLGGGNGRGHAYGRGRGRGR